MDDQLDAYHDRLAEAEIEANGGHTAECEQFCHPRCLIGQAKTAEAHRRAAWAQKEWNDQKWMPSEA